MNYGFVIDNRRCIGCHACTVACKSEHEVSIGVNRTHVKYVEKGEFPHTIREFSVHRCNHCEAAPCVEICPTSALYTRADGIVDFDNNRCIGCKACMQACPYDALYIDPDTHTAAKCNYCAHRVETGYEPACVIICPVEAIISGDLGDPESNISRMVDTEPVVVRKPEKHTQPNLYYIEGDSSMLIPGESPRQNNYLWSAQAAGVGHYAEHAADPKAASSSGDILVQMAMETHARQGTAFDQRAMDDVLKELKDQEKPSSRRVYDSPSKGVLWDWHLPTYIVSKALGAGLFMAMILWELFGGGLEPAVERNGLITSLLFMVITGGLLVHELDRPDRFLYVLLRPHWTSWLVLGGYSIAGFSTVLLLLLLHNLFGWPVEWLMYPGLALALLTTVYTAFLLAQAKGRDSWQSPLAPLIMLIHAVIGGSLGMMILYPESITTMTTVLTAGLFVYLATILFEVITPHGSSDAQQAVKLMLKGYYARMFYSGIILGILIPVGILFLMEGTMVTVLAGVLALVGVFLVEFVRIRVPQLISLS